MHGNIPYDAQRLTGGAAASKRSLLVELADPGAVIPELIRGSMKLLIEEIRLLEARIAQLEKELTALAQQSPACKELLTVPGIGLLTATAMVAATSGEVGHYRDARQLRQLVRAPPKEYSSGSTRHLGRISKRGDRYLRMLLTHGGPTGGQTDRWSEGLGIEGAGANQPQQSYVCVGEQAGAHLLCSAQIS